MSIILCSFHLYLLQFLLVDFGMTSCFEIKSATKVFDGSLIRFSHMSEETKTTMTCSVFLPHSASDPEPKKCATLMYLSGLTCTDENVCQKSGIFKILSQHQMAFVAPDTSPRGAGIQGESNSWDFGLGAGFYVDATASPWAENYRMYSYITKELPTVLAEHFPTLDLAKMGLTGHSMGGHGALTIALKNPEMFRSVSAFSPICNPINCDWGKKAFKGYLGDSAEEQEEWNLYDACVIVGTVPPGRFDEILIDCGTADSFLKAGQLLPEAFKTACDKAGQKTNIRYQEGYDHSYNFISTFIEDHVKFHASRLG